MKRSNEKCKGRVDSRYTVGQKHTGNGEMKDLYKLHEGVGDSLTVWESASYTEPIYRQGSYQLTPHEILVGFFQSPGCY